MLRGKPDLVVARPKRLFEPYGCARGITPGHQGAPRGRTSESRAQERAASYGPHGSPWGSVYVNRFCKTRSGARWIPRQRDPREEGPGSGSGRQPPRVLIGTVRLVAVPRGNQQASPLFIGVRSWGSRRAPSSCLGWGTVLDGAPHLARRRDHPLPSCAAGVPSASPICCCPSGVDLVFVKSGFVVEGVHYVPGRPGGGRTGCCSRSQPLK